MNQYEARTKKMALARAVAIATGMPIITAQQKRSKRRKAHATEKDIVDTDKRNKS